MGLLDDALAGSTRALARLASVIENDPDQGQRALERLYSAGGKAMTVGVTGPPGAGKSTLVNRLIAAWRAHGHRVAVIAVDPSSPLTGGALLGDRIRMLEFHDDPGVFVRSMASRGRAGGLAPTTASLLHLFDAAGFDIVLVETVGIGQEEVAVAHVVETVVVVQAPGFGDGVQALKAGVLEVADVFAVNKADLPGADELRRHLRAILTLAPGGVSSEWEAPVLAVSATDGTGITDLVDALDSHAAWLRQSGEIVERHHAIARAEVVAEMRRRVERRLYTNGLDDRIVAAAIERVARRSLTPFAAAAQLLEGWSGA